MKSRFGDKETNKIDENGQLRHKKDEKKIH